MKRVLQYHAGHQLENKLSSPHSFRANQERYPVSMAEGLGPRCTSFQEQAEPFRKILRLSERFSEGSDDPLRFRLQK